MARRVHFPIVRVNHLVEKLDVHISVRRKPEVFLHALVPEQLVKRKVAEPVANARGIGGKREALPLLLYLLLRGLCICDVQYNANKLSAARSRREPFD